MFIRKIKKIKKTYMSRANKVKVINHSKNPWAESGRQMRLSVEPGESITDWTYKLENAKSVVSLIKE